MSSPTASQDQPPSFPSQQDQNGIQNPEYQEDPSLLELEQERETLTNLSPKTLTLQIPNLPDNPNPQDVDQNQDDPDSVTPFSPSATSYRRCGGGGPKRRKMGKKRHALQEKKSQRKLEKLLSTLKPIPFVPIKTLDFSAHESLLKRLGLWDFVHLEFDQDLRTDLIAQLIASFNPQLRCSYVNGVRIMVNRADLARALKLPVKKDKVNNLVDNVVLEAKASEECISFIEELVSNWLLLHEDTWMMPAEVLNWSKVIKEGNFERVDWAGLIWFMVDKELTADNLGNCYYASHLQCIIKCQREDLLEAKMEVDVQEGVRMEDELHGGSSADLEEHKIELSLGGLENVVKQVDDDDNGEKEPKEDVDEDEDLGIVAEDAMDFEETKEEEEEEEQQEQGQGQGLRGSMDAGFLQPCNGVNELRGTECEEGKHEEQEAEEDGKDREEEEEEEEEEEVEEEDMDFNLSPKGVVLDGLSSENLIASMGAPHLPFSSGVQIRDDQSSGEFLASSVDTETVPGGSSLFGNLSGSKREVGHIDSGMPHHSLNVANKRMRSDEPWDMKLPPDFDTYMEQMQQLMEKSRMLYGAKEQACQEMSMHQQVLYSELQRRENMIQHLQKASLEGQKRQVEIYRLERELHMMGNLLEGYRKALKETHKAFAEYRAKCPLPEEPIYKDAGCGGLVLSATELEKQRLKQEEEERLNRLMIEKKIDEFEAEWLPKFEAHKNGVELLGNKLLDVEKKIELLKEIPAKRKAPEVSESSPAEE